MLSIGWETTTRLSEAPAPVVTGDDASEPAAPTAPVAPAKPALVWITDGGVEDFDKIEDVVFKAEKVALAAKAFRTVKMGSEDAERDPLLADHGSEVPRILVLDGVGGVKVLEKNRLTSGGVYDALRKAAAKFYDENLDKLVKEQLKLLTEVDKLSAEESLLAEKETKLAAEKDASGKEMEEVRKDLGDVRAQLEDLAAKQRSAWNLTPKA